MFSGSCSWQWDGSSNSSLEAQPNVAVNVEEQNLPETDIAIPFYFLTGNLFLSQYIIIYRIFENL